MLTSQGEFHETRSERVWHWATHFRKCELKPDLSSWGRSTCLPTSVACAADEQTLDGALSPLKGSFLGAGLRGQLQPRTWETPADLGS